MSAELERILDACLSRMEAGVSYQDLLASYPEHAEDLLPLLQAAAFVSVRQAPRARSEAYQAGIKKMLAAASTSSSIHNNKLLPVSFPGFRRYVERVAAPAADLLKTIFIGKDQRKMILALRLAIDLIVMMAIGGAMTVGASANSLPGDNTYGIKRAWEQVRLNLTLDDQAHQKLEDQINQERFDEVQQLILASREGEVEFSGWLTAQDGEIWTIGGLPVRVTPATEIEGSPTPGEWVKVEAFVDLDGNLTAHEIEGAGGSNGSEPNPVPLPSTIPYPGHDGDDHEDDLYDDLDDVEDGAGDDLYEDTDDDSYDDLDEDRLDDDQLDDASDDVYDDELDGGQDDDDDGLDDGSDDSDDAIDDVHDDDVYDDDFDDGLDDDSDDSDDDDDDD